MSAAGRAGPKAMALTQFHSLEACVACGERDHARLNHHVALPAWLIGGGSAGYVISLCDRCHNRFEKTRRAGLRISSIVLWLLIGAMLYGLFTLV